MITQRDSILPSGRERGTSLPVLNLNFASGRKTIARRITAILWALSLLLFIGTGLLVFHANSMARINAKTEGKIERLSMKWKEISNSQTDVPTKKEIVALRSKITTINGLSDISSPSMTSVLAKLETTLPPQAILAELSYDRTLGQVKLAAISKDVQDLTNFLHQLEKVSLFKSVRLQRRNKVKGKGPELIQFNIKLIVGKPKK